MKVSHPITTLATALILTACTSTGTSSQTGSTKTLTPQSPQSDIVKAVAGKWTTCSNLGDIPDSDPRKAQLNAIKPALQQAGIMLDNVSIFLDMTFKNTQSNQIEVNSRSQGALYANKNCTGNKLIDSKQENMTMTGRFVINNHQLGAPALTALGEEYLDVHNTNLLDGSAGLIKLSKDGKRLALTDQQGNLGAVFQKQ